ncbi:MAG: hypothetical protein AVDCRST_MAG01-01-1560, partial [uncultured Rubrobacteraceae bacterium]
DPAGALGHRRGAPVPARRHAHLPGYRRGHRAGDGQQPGNRT